MYKPIYEDGYGEPKKTCLQKYISLTSYLNLLVSIIAIAFGIYQAVRQNQVWNGAYDWNTSLVAGLLVCSSLLFLCSLSGILGSRKRNRCLIFFFQLFSLALAVVFGVIGFVFLAVTNDHIAGISDANCSNTDSIDIYYQSQNAYNEASSMLCRTCACNINNQDVLASIAQQGIIFPQGMVNANGVTQVQDCPDYKAQFTGNMLSQVDWLQSLEDTFQCTGMCTKPVNPNKPKDASGENLYFFSDINNGVPSDTTCKQKFEDFVSTYGEIIYIVGLLVAAYLLFNSLISFFLCCKNKSAGQSNYERFAQF